MQQAQREIRWEGLRDLLRARTAAPDSISALADRAEISQSALLRFMNGETKTLRRKSIERLATELGLEVDELLFTEDRPGVPGSLVLTIELDGDTADVLQAYAATRRTALDDVLSSLVARAAEDVLVNSPGIREVIEAIRQARLAESDR